MSYRQTFKVKDAQSIEQGACVKLEAGELVPTTAIDDACIGVIEDSASGGELRAVNMLGPCLVKVDTDLGGNIAKGDLIVCGPSGMARKDPSTGSTDAAIRVIGEAMEASSGESGALIRCLIGRVFEDRDAVA